MSKNEETYFSDDENNENESHASSEEEEVGDDEYLEDENILAEEEKDVVDVPLQEEEEQAYIENGENAEDDDEEEDEDEHYLQKFDAEITKNYIADFHPECAIHNKTEISAMTQVVRDANGEIIDDLHRTLPFITKFERARIIGQRASQINSGATPFIRNIPANIIDGYLIAEMEVQQKTIPFIIRRPLTNGGSEYWRVKDLQNILF